MHHVSCIIPAFNAERYLGAALASVLAQTRVPDEIIVVDDGSTDGTGETARRHDPRVRLIRQDNAGPAAARNRGVRASSGSVVAFLDADDLWEPAKVELQLHRLTARPDLDFCVTMLCNFVSDDIGPRRVRDPRLLEPVAGFSLSTLMVRRSTLERVGLFDEARKHSDDTDWLLRAQSHDARHELLPEVLVRRRLHDSNLSQRSGADSRDEYLHLVKAMLDRRRGRQPGATGGE